MNEQIETLPETFSAGVLHDCLGPTPRSRPVYVIIDGEKRCIVEVKDRVTDCIELHIAPEAI